MKIYIELSIGNFYYVQFRDKQGEILLESVAFETREEAVRFCERIDRIIDTNYEIIDSVK